ncbi:uncharacterized protein isoform X2 [Danio rerio]|uniref:Uncharacterized protein isoform X2 n=1 Tax=Danio rerio TaxID=7955 RepID=A0AC58G441_DANRE
MRWKQVIDVFSAALRQSDDIHKIVKTVADLFILASECGEKELKRLSTACSYSNFPFSGESKILQSIFFLGLFSQLKERSSWQTVLLVLKPILNVAPSVWTVDLLKLEKTSVFTELLKLQALRKPVELMSGSCKKEKLRFFLNCLPYVSEFRCDEQFFQTVCEVLLTDSEWNPKQIAELLRSLGFSISLIGMLSSHLCKAVGSVFEQLEKDCISLNLLPQKISYQGCAYLFSKVRKLKTLRVNEIAASKLTRLARSDKEMHPITVEELSVVLSDCNLQKRELCQLLSSLTSLLRVWTVHSLNLSECQIEPHMFICLLCHQSPLSIRFHEDTLQQLAEVVCDAQDENLTQLFLEKIDGDLSPCCLSWDVLSCLIQVAKKKVTIDLSEDRFNVLNIPRLLPVLDKVCFKSISPLMVRAALKEIYEERAGHLIVKLVQSSANLINLCMRELDSADCKALCFALHYSDGVKLNLLNSVIPNNETDSIVKLMHRVSELRVDRKLLLNFLHMSKNMWKQGHALLTALNNKLDFSFSSSLDSGFAQEKEDLLTLCYMDCEAITSAIETSTFETELILYDCQAEDSALETLFPVLHKVHLRLGKSLLCQLVTLISNAPMAMSLKWASSLSKALGKELDLSDTPLNYRTCESLQLVLDYTEDLTHLNLSHCQITDACLDLFLPHLHKILTLDFTGNYITDKGVLRLRTALDVNHFTKAICLCDNHITEIGLLMEESRFETQPASTRCSQKYITKDLQSNSKTEKSMTAFVQREDTVKEFEPEIAVINGEISYRFQCESEGFFMCGATGLVFGMKSSGCVEYSVVHWDPYHLINTRYEPAGPLFDIKTPAGEIYELHLPHCETHVDAIGNISVIHMHNKDSREFLSPFKISKTHVAVNISGLSTYGTVYENDEQSRSIRGQVLLFHEPDLSEALQRLWVFLLPGNVPLSEIKAQQQEYVYIQTTSD